MSISGSRLNISAFDVDYTLLNCNCCYRFGLYLYRRKLISFSTLLTAPAAFLLYKSGLISMSKISLFGFNYVFKGRSEPFLKQSLEEFLDKELENLLNPPVLQRLKLAQDAGHLVVLFSTTANFIVEAIAKRLEVPLWYSTQYLLDNELRFCSVQSIMQGEDKARNLIQLCQQHGIPRQNVTAYSDSSLDLPFLEAAGFPVGVNPDRKLRAICKRNRWPII